MSLTLWSCCDTLLSTDGGTNAARHLGAAVTLCALNIVVLLWRPVRLVVELLRRRDLLKIVVLLLLFGFVLPDIWSFYNTTTAEPCSARHCGITTVAPNSTQPCEVTAPT